MVILNDEYININLKPLRNKNILYICIYSYYIINTKMLHNNYYIYIYIYIYKFTYILNT